MTVGASGYDQRMMREARMGLMIIIALFVTLTYFGYQYLRSRGDQIPDYVWQAPLAIEIDPDDVLQMTRRRLGHAPVDERPESLGERFADQRTEFQPTQPMPRQTSEPRSLPAELPSGLLNPKLVNPPHQTSSDPNPKTSETSDQKFQSALQPPTKTEVTKPTESPATWETMPATVPPTAQSVTVQSPPAQSPPAQSPPARASTPGQPIGLTVLPNAQPLPSSRDFQPLIDSKTIPPAVTAKPLSESSAFQPHMESKPPQSPIAVKPQPPVTPPEWPKQFELKSHDSLWDAARTIYGDGQWFRALYQHNLTRLEGTTDRQKSVMLECPAPLDLANRFPELAPPDFVERDETRTVDPTQYMTVTGDSLFEIARQQLGQASRYLELLELNRDRLPPAVSHLTRLPAGIKLTLPK